MDDKENTNEKKLKKQSKKYISIDVDENIETNNNIIFEPNSGLAEVKNRKFNKTSTTEKKVLYDGYEFYEDPHKPSKYPEIINYRCSNYRKNERNLKNKFCNALLKRRQDKNTIYFILEKGHSLECSNLHTINIKNDTNLIGNYNDYINKCFKYLDSTRLQ